MDVRVLIPVKRLEDAKTRLAALLGADERVTLMRALLADVAAAARAAPSVRAVAAATSDGEVAALARDLGLGVADDGGLPWNEGLAHAVRGLEGRPDLVAIVAADLPLLRAADVEALVRATPARGAAIARARDGGTNALSLRPPTLLRPSFGEPASAARHAERVRGVGAEARILDRPGLAHDLDTPADAERALAHAGGRALGLLRELYRNRSEARSRTSSRAAPSSTPAS